MHCHIQSQAWACMTASRLIQINSLSLNKNNKNTYIIANIHMYLIMIKKNKNGKPPTWAQEMCQKTSEGSPEKEKERIDAKPMQTYCIIHESAHEHVSLYIYLILIKNGKPPTWAQENISAHAYACVCAYVRESTSVNVSICANTVCMCVNKLASLYLCVVLCNILDNSSVMTHSCMCSHMLVRMCVLIVWIEHACVCMSVCMWTDIYVCIHELICMILQS